MKKISTYLLLSLTALLPLLILPIGATFIAQIKIWLVFAVALILLALIGLKFFKEKNITITLSPLTSVLSIFSLVIIATTLLTSHYPVANFLGLGGVYLSTLILAGLGSELATKSLTKLFIPILSSSAAFLGIVSIIQLLGVDPSWLSRSPLVIAQFLGVALIGVGTKIYTQLKENKSITLIAWVTATLIALGLVVNLYSILPGQPLSPVLPPFSISWSVAIDMLRTPQTALLGAGPGNYHLAYTQFKPAWVNQTQLWNLQFDRGFNLPLTLLVTTGILGLASWIWLVLKIFKQIKRYPHLKRSPLTWMLISLLALQLLLPPFSWLLVMFGLVLAAWLTLPDHQRHPSSHKHYPLTSQGLGVILNIIFLTGVYGLGRAAAAEYIMSAASQAGQKNQAVEMYELQQRAVKLNPFLASYRRRYALTSLSIATALSNKTDPSDQEKTQALQLVEQAIREGRAATALQKDDYSNWQTLAQIYSNLTGIAAGADQWAVNSYVQAIQASPADPDLRLALGAIFFNANQYEQAAQLFSQAVSLKSNHPNAHYSLANALKKQGNLTAAVTAYENVLILIEPSTQDYQVATDELTAVKAELAKQTQEVTQAQQVQAKNKATQPSLIEENLGLDKQQPIAPAADLQPVLE